MCICSLTYTFFYFSSLELRIPITLLLSEPRGSDEIGSFTSDEWTILAQAEEVLQRCLKGTTEISGKILASCSKAIAFTKRVANILTPE